MSTPGAIHANNRKLFLASNNQVERAPDSICVLDATEYIIDVTIRNPGLPSYFKKPVDTVLLNAEKSKRKKYLGCTGTSVFVPFALDLNGNLGSAATEFLGKLFAFDKSKDRLVLKSFMRRLSLCLARDLSTLFSLFHANIFADSPHV